MLPVFIDLNQFTKKSLKNTVAHELNHTIYYYRHYKDLNNFSLLDEILFEGLAENFKEQYFDSGMTPWAGSLTKDEAFNVLYKGKGFLNSQEKDVINDFLFGNEVWKKWTGYSTGYWLVKDFIEKSSDISWNKLMKSDKKEFLSILK